MCFNQNTFGASHITLKKRIEKNGALRRIWVRTSQADLEPSSGEVPKGAWVIPVPGLELNLELD